MRFLFLPLLSLLFNTTSFAQGTIDNYSFFKLYVVNDKDEILLVKWNNEWEVMGERYNQGLTIPKFVDTLAQSMGIKISQVKLAALFTQRPASRPNLTIMHYFTARYKEGTIKPPADCSDIKWFKYEDAMKVIPYEIMKNVIGQIKKHPGKVVSAAFETTTDQKNITTVKVLEEFHTLN